MGNNKIWLYTDNLFDFLNLYRESYSTHLGSIYLFFSYPSWYFFMVLETQGKKFMIFSMQSVFD